MFGDTFMDQVSEDRSRSSFMLINNSLILQDGLTFKLFTEALPISQRHLQKPLEASDWYWSGDATVANGKLYLFMHGFGNDDGGDWDFFRTSIDLLTVDPETFEIKKNHRLFDDVTVSWGAAVMGDTDLYLHIRSFYLESQERVLYMARTNPDLTAEWEYFDDAIWDKDPLKANSILSV